jgi:hypothetical protein
MTQQFDDGELLTISSHSGPYRTVEGSEFDWNRVALISNKADNKVK